MKLKHWLLTIGMLVIALGVNVLLSMSAWNSGASPSDENYFLFYAAVNFWWVGAIAFFLIVLIVCGLIAAWLNKKGK